MQVAYIYFSSEKIISDFLIKKIQQNQEEQSKEQ